MQEVKLNYVEMTPTQYGMLFDPPLSKNAVTSRCEQGILQAYRTEGGHWKIRVPKDDSVSRDEYNALIKENAELKAIINTMRKLLSTAI